MHMQIHMEKNKQTHDKDNGKTQRTTDTHTQHTPPTTPQTDFSFVLLWQIFKKLTAYLF